MDYHVHEEEEGPLNSNSNADAVLSQQHGFHLRLRVVEMQFVGILVGADAAAGVVDAVGAMMAMCKYRAVVQPMIEKRDFLPWL